MGHKNCKLSKSELKELIESTKLSEKEILKFHKDFFSCHPIGNLNRDEFRETYERLYPGSANSNMVDNIFRAFDLNKDNTIEFREFLVLVSVTSRGSTDERLALAFRIYDLDGDGFISKWEVISILTNVYYLNGLFRDLKEANKTAIKDANKFMKKMDVDKDGKVSLEEFLTKAREGDNMKEVMKAFDSS